MIRRRSCKTEAAAAATYVRADPRGCLILIAAGSLTAFMTPAATAAVAMAMSAGGYDVKSLFKMSAIIAVALMVIYVGYVSMVYPAF